MIINTNNNTIGNRSCIQSRNHFILSDLKMCVDLRTIFYLVFQYLIVYLLFGIRINCKNKPGIPEVPFIFASNHTSHLDTVAILLSIPVSIRRRMVVLAAKDYFFSKKRFAWARWLFGLVPLDRKGGLITLRKIVEKATNSNYGVLLFPEGTRSRDGQIHQFKPGIGYVSATLDMPVIPVFVSGNYKLMNYSKVIPSRGTVQVKFGLPMYGVGKSPVEFTRQIENAVRKLQNECLLDAA